MINIELKFIVDVGVSNKVENWLAAQGFDVVNVRDIDPRLPDQEIVKIAATTQGDGSSVLRRLSVYFSFRLHLQLSLLSL